MVFIKGKSTIKHVRARQIIDSRGQPTLEVEVMTQAGVIGIAGVPSGASTGKKEALELRDGGSDYFGKGVLDAAENITTEINNVLTGVPVADQKEIDQRLIELDGTPNKSRLGGNALLGVSLACARAAALSQDLPLFIYLNRIAGLKRVKPSLPRPMFNLINGGLHADSGLDIQEFLFIPTGASMAEAVRMAVETYHSLANDLHAKKLSIGIGDEGGFAPHLQHDTEAFDFIIEAARAYGYELGTSYALGMDAAANSFLETSEPFKYKLGLENKTVDSAGLINMYSDWIDKYKLLSIEDGLAEDDKEGWRLMTERLSHKAHVVGQKVELVGDDLFVTQAQRIVDGARDKLGTAIIIKPNQVGTLTETISTVRQAKTLGYACVASHRSGETNDDFIADLAVGLGCEYIKAGAPARGERVAKYNRLMKIEELLEGNG